VPRPFLIGYTAQADRLHAPLPRVAPVAEQQSACAAWVIAARLAGSAPPAAFRYRDFRRLATSGQHEAAIDFGRVRLTGRFAWLLWGVAYVYLLTWFRNCMAVVLDWLWSYLTYQHNARTITGQEM
jgi:NADH:quinone reductase (non-electrogenic)